jgi:integrase
VNVDFSRGVIRVRETKATRIDRAKQSAPGRKAKGNRIKDRAERSIPIPNELAEALKAWKEQRPDTVLVLGTVKDKPNSKWLQTLKRTARFAELNCGECGGCQGSGDCSRWYLHKFRATYTTRLLREGMDARSVMDITGHEDIETVMRYWKPLGLTESAAKIEAIYWRPAPAPQAGLPAVIIK